MGILIGVNVIGAAEIERHIYPASEITQTRARRPPVATGTILPARKPMDYRVLSVHLPWRADMR